MTTNTNAASADLHRLVAKAFSEYLDDCYKHAIKRDIVSAFTYAFEAGAALSTAAQPPTHDGGYPAELRDYFAAAALQGWLASFGVEADHPAVSRCSATVAHQAYVMADAMLAIRAGDGEASND